MNLAKVDATTVEETRRYLIEDGFDPENPLAGFREVLPVATLRKRTGLTQDAFATALGVPVATVRNWEQGRTPPDLAARSLLALVATSPEWMLERLAQRRTEPERGANRVVKVVISEPEPNVKLARVFDTQEAAVEHASQIVPPRFTILDAEYVRDPERALKDVT